MPTPDLNSLPDANLIQICLNSGANRAQAWEALILRYQRLIYSIPRHYGLSDNEAGDVAQAVCLLLLENLARLRNHQRLGAWLITTTRRECWRQLRRRQSTTNELDPVVLESQPDETVQPEDDLIHLERLALVRAALSRLEPRCQRLLKLLFYADPRPSYEEIVKTLGLPEGSIGPTRARCLQKLLNILEQTRFFD